MRLLVAAISGLIASSAFAHHGSNGQFDQSQEIEVAGVVTDIRFVNPHSYVYFDVTNEDGSVDPWRCELRAGSLLKRTGWSTDMFATGTSIEINGAPARREEFGCYTNTITFANGRVVTRYEEFEEGAAAAAIAPVSVTLADGTPNLNGTWVAPPRNPGGAAPGGAAGGRAAAGGPAAGERPAGGPPAGGRRGRQIAQTEAGIAASAGFEREDNPRFHCQPTNIFLDWTFDQHVNEIEQSDDKIVLRFGFMDLVRTIHLDMDAHPANITPSRAGHSIGSWDGDTLVVDTIGFAEGYIDATFSGAKHSEAAYVVERFSLSEDGNTLSRSYTLSDALYLKEDFSGQDSVNRTAAAFDAYECEDLTEEIVDGF